MIKAPMSLQDLRRRIYAKAKAKRSWWKRRGLGWKRWSRQGTLPKALPVPEVP